MRVVPKPNHLSPFECGVFAGRSQVGKLILFHLYDNIPQDEALNEIRKNFEGEVIFPKDLQIIDA